MATKSRSKAKETVTTGRRTKPAAKPAKPVTRSKPVAAKQDVAPELARVLELARMAKHDEAFVLATTTLASAQLTVKARVVLLEARVESLLRLADVQRADDDVAELLVWAARDGSAALHARVLACQSLVLLRSEQFEEALESGTRAVHAARHPLRILLAEDNLVNQKLALRLLSQMGYRADLATNGIEAIESLERQPYDIVLMDVPMPEMDGREASRRIPSRWTIDGRPRIVAMTANAKQGDRERCLAAGMDDYIAKPIRVERLIEALSATRPRTGLVASG